MGDYQAGVDPSFPSATLFSNTLGVNSFSLKISLRSRWMLMQPKFTNFSSRFLYQTIFFVALCMLRIKYIPGKNLQIMTPTGILMTPQNFIFVQIRQFQKSLIAIFSASLSGTPSIMMIIANTPQDSNVNKIFFIV